MILEISSGTDKVAVEISTNNGSRKIRLGGTEILCDWLRLADGHYSLILDGSVLDVLVNVDPETCVVTSSTGTYTFRVMDSRRAASRQKAEPGASGLQHVYAEMPGKIVRVLVGEGETVGYDQGLLVLEAMKMQNEIRAPKDGVVRKIAATPGSTVKAGDLLLSIES